ncbi:MAG: hypothetical protein MZV65_05695 [Chromatiales bacterium]|nr:hypothetical protein [Chromatiales bacterium]
MNRLAMGCGESLRALSGWVANVRAESEGPEAPLTLGHRRERAAEPNRRKTTRRTQ